ncbi:MAG: D-aminoacyl-tRNA deacylase [Erysipelotrichaceae bacterium]|nr:D-aminoacyl-tRNA deacylase [Erysipelotrichaceae bacterium]
MKVLLQTVNSASVKVLNKEIASISRGYLLLVGFGGGDTKETVDLMVDKVLALRAFADGNRQINLSIKDVNGSILSVSQFTLYANTTKGRRPSFIDALNPREAQDLYDYFNSQLEQKHGKVSSGLFGADMDVISSNDGPFTLILDSKELWPL